METGNKEEIQKTIVSKGSKYK